MEGTVLNFNHLRVANARFHTFRSVPMKTFSSFRYFGNKTYPRNLPQCTGYGKYYAIVNGQLDFPEIDAVVSECPAARKFSSFMQQQLQLARRCLDDAKQRQRAYLQKGLQDSAFLEGDYVWLTVNIRRRLSGTPKLMPRYVGPFKVLKQMGETSYQLDLKETGKRMHDVFHSSLLKKHKGPIPA